MATFINLAMMLSKLLSGEKIIIFYSFIKKLIFNYFVKFSYQIKILFYSVKKLKFNVDIK